MPKTNAAATQRGYHFQDFTALYLFIDRIKEAEWINVEGKEDIDLMYSDGTMHYFQVKEVHKITTQIPAAEIRKAIQVLASDWKNETNRSKIKELAIVTNTNKPFGATSGSLFESPYMNVSFSDLDPTNQTKLQQYLKKLEQNKPEIDLKDFKISQLSVLKIQYYGEDPSSRIQILKTIVQELLLDAKLPTERADSLIKTWRLLLSDSTEDPNKKIDKKEFAAHTEASLLDSPRFDDFFDKFDITAGNEDYIRREYHDHLEIMGQDFSVFSKISGAFNQFRKKHPGLRHSEIQFNFTNEFAHSILPELGLSNSTSDLEISKLIIWLVIQKSNTFQSVEGAFGIER